MCSMAKPPVRTAVAVLEHQHDVQRPQRVSGPQVLCPHQAVAPGLAAVLDHHDVREVGVQLRGRACVHVCACVHACVARGGAPGQHEWELCMQRAGQQKAHAIQTSQPLHLASHRPCHHGPGTAAGPGGVTQLRKHGAVVCGPDPLSVWEVQGRMRACARAHAHACPPPPPLPPGC